MNTPQYGIPQYGNPQYGDPQYGNPQYGDPQYGIPQYGDPQQPGYQQYPPDGPEYPGCQRYQQHQPGGTPYPRYQPGTPQGYGPRGPSDDHTWALLTYLLTFVASILAPLVIYLVKKNESPYVRFHAAQALNLGLTELIYCFGLVIVSTPLAVITHGVGIVVTVVAFVALLISHLVFLIVGAVKSGQGQLYRIPAFLCLRLVR